MKFDNYIGNITRRAYQRTGLIFRGFISRNNGLLMRAYMTYVRPILEYSTCVWSPYMLKDIRQVEDVQRYFTRRMFPKCTLSYSERLAILGLESLECRRLKFDLKCILKSYTIRPIWILQNFSCFRTMNVPKLVGITVTCSKNISFPAIGCLILSAIEQLIAGMLCLRIWLRLGHIGRFCSKIRKLDITKFVKGM